MPISIEVDNQGIKAPLYPWPEREDLRVMGRTRPGLKHAGAACNQRSYQKPAHYPADAKHEPLSEIWE